MSKEQNKTIQIPSDNLFPVVGVGASAGGLDAFKELVKAIPEDSGMAYILVQHLAPKFESMLPDILQKLTALPVLEITDNIKVMPDHIYIIPSNKVLTANDGVLQLDPQITGEKINTIDVFFTSLAEIHQEYSIGIVLSGTGSDGTVGLKTIKDLGGITIVQDKHSAAYYGMPQSAIDAEVVDFVLLPGEMPKHLQELVRISRAVHLDIDRSEDQEENTFKQILTLLRVKRGVDFTYYKQTTIRRRLLRRKALNKIETLNDYQDFLLENKAEQDALFKDILIPVTAFFRDPKSFAYLCETVFPVLFKEKPAAEPIRIWIAGCSTGEEAYSMAICIHECLGDESPGKRVQIFATDVSESSISKARSGIYQKRDIAGVSEARIKKYFSKIDGSYQISQDIRQMCVFASQNFLKDPPFARLDLVSCRNVLIYMESYLQKKALTTFHYALNETGFLFLGKSETTGQSPELFNTVSLQDKLYKRKDVTGKYMPVATESNEAAFKRNDDNLKSKEVRRDDFQKAADDALLFKYAAVGVIVNEQLDIIQFRGSTGPYLEAPPGKASHNVLKMAREGMAFELRNTLHKAKTGNEPVRKEGIPLDQGKRKVTIEVIPLKHTIEPYFLVLFTESEDQPVLALPKTADSLERPEDARLISELERIAQLEKELAQVREDMRTITEDQEAANEELQSANEELLSGGEELQSLNEELETSKEEIQSSNEELMILNQELVERNEQLIHSRKYSEAIVTTIHEPLVILTKDFRVKSGNRSFYEQFGITEQQTEGKMFFELQDGKWNVMPLPEKLQMVLPNQAYFENFELHVASSPSAEKVMLLNARQIINESSNEQLILLAIQDITEQKKFEYELEIKVAEQTEELRKTNINLRQSNENLQQFASIASHDLQEPLRKIKTFANILKKQFSKSLSEEGKDIINRISVSTDRMSQLIKEVLEYSKVSQGAKNFIPTNLNIILKNVLTDLDLLISERNATITYNDDLPVIDAIPLQVNQLFYNLLVNALKFHNETIPPLMTVSFRILSDREVTENQNLKKDVPHMEICFSDNGIGFEQQFADQIFQLFERLNPLDEYEGTGMGLALCKKIVENHHGDIFALSRENEGAKFYVILPLKQ
jgi:two-component system CheB/CheR fusion protein